MVALYTVFYSWTKVHKMLRVAPAMAAGLTDRVWDMAEVVVVARLDGSEKSTQSN